MGNNNQANKTTCRHSRLLQDTLEAELPPRKRNLLELSEKYYDKFGYPTAEGASNLLKQFRAGFYFATTGTPAEPALRLEQLGYLLYVLKIPASHPLIEEMTEVIAEINEERKEYPLSFTYPPQEQPQEADISNII